MRHPGISSSLAGEQAGRGFLPVDPPGRKLRVLGPRHSCSGGHDMTFPECLPHSGNGTAQADAITNRMREASNVALG